MKQYIPIIILIFLWGCNNAYIDDVDRGAGYNFQPGYPELRLSTTGLVAEDNSTHIIVSGDVVYGSLVYANIEEEYEASFTIDLVIFEDNKEQKKVESVTFSQKITTEDDKIINSQDVHRFEKEFEVPAGEYVIQAIITDIRSGKQTERRTSTSIPNPEDEVAHITEIRILGKDIDELNEFIPITTYDVPARFDTIQFVFQITNNKPDEPITIESRLLQFRSDTSIARPMSFNTPSPSTLPYKGIDHDRYQEVQTSRRTLNQPGSVVIEFKFTDLQRGNYRLEVISDYNEEGDIYKARDFGIKSENYPSLGTPEELAKPLFYIMDEDEYENLMAIEDNVKLKQAIDRFWLSNIKNSIVARQVISLYYQRVEEANKQFSNFKEGWKTDPGMIYILFGPPWYVDVYADRMIWSYSYNHSDQEKNFVFTRPTIRNKFFPFDHFQLLRYGYYYNIHYEQVNRWRSGRILNIDL